MCYRNLVREYELLVNRYLQLYRPPTMIDRGTDPMEPSHYNSGTQTANNAEVDPSVPGPSGIKIIRNPACSNPEPSTSAASSSNSPSTDSTTELQPSTSHSQNLITPSRIFSVTIKPPSSIRGTQTMESRKRKSHVGNSEKRPKRNRNINESSSSSRDSSPSQNRQSRGTSNEQQNNSDEQRVLVVNLERLSPERIPSTSVEPSIDPDMAARTRECSIQRRSSFSREGNSSSLQEFLYHNVRLPTGSTSSPSEQQQQQQHSERFNEYIRANRERILAFKRTIQNATSTEESSVTPEENVDARRNLSRETVEPLARSLAPRSDSYSSSYRGDQRIHVQELIASLRRTAEEEVRTRILPIIRSVPPPDRPELIRLFENSREHVRLRFREMCPVFLRRHCRRPLTIDSSTDSSSSDNETTTESSRINPQPNARIDNASAVSSTSSGVSPRRERNFNTELEQLVTSLLTEIDWNDDSPNASDSSNSSRGGSNDRAPNSTSARTRPTGSPNSWASLERLPSPPGDSIESILTDSPTRPDEDIYRRVDQVRLDRSQPAPITRSTLENPTPHIVSMHRPPHLPVYPTTMPSPSRRRFFSHRVSAFMPTRVNYSRMRTRRNPHITLGTGRGGVPRSYRTSSVVLDRIINMVRVGDRRGGVLDMDMSDDQNESSQSSSQNQDAMNRMYTNIVQNLESSLMDVQQLRLADRPGETTNMLNSFSERLENIMSQSDNILRNLRSTMDLLPNADSNNTDNELRWNFNDQGFYSAERTTASNSDEQDLQNVIEADHTYPRNPNYSGTNENNSPFVNSLQLTITHIHRQARLLRRQVENIERIDRAMVEVSQLQVMRQLVIEMLRHIQTRTVCNENRSAGVSSVRQMMAGTRISDSSPCDSPNDEPGPSGIRTQQSSNADPSHAQPSTSSGTTFNSDQSGPSSGIPSQSRRSTNRKTYPPSRYVRLARQHQRRPTLVHWFAKRSTNRPTFDRGIRPTPQSRSGPSRPPAAHSSGSAPSQIFNYWNINPATLSLMTRRLERLMSDQMRIFTRVADESPTSSTRPSASVDLGENILALRLHGCLLRINRVLGNRIESSSLRNPRSEASPAAATQDGASRYAARHTLSLIVDGMSRYIEELGNGSVSNMMRTQIHGVLAMSLLLIELLMLQVVDSIPPPSGINLDPERESLARRIDDMCTQMLQCRDTGASVHLRRSLKLMRLTMRHAYRALDQTYTARRNAMLPRQDTDRRQLLGTINRCLRTINSTQDENSSPTHTNSTTDNQQRSTASSNDSNNSDIFFNTINDFVLRYSVDRDENPINLSSNDRTSSMPPSTSQQNRQDASLSSNNSDDDPVDEPDWFYYRGNSSTNNNSNINTGGTGGSASRSNNSTLYRTNNVNLLPYSQSPESRPPTYRPWNIPSVQVNDVPVLEPSLYSQRILAHRQRFAERVSELRTNTRGSLFRPRFLHPLYASVNPFDADLDDPQREQIYDSDMVTTVTPNHRIQVWDISEGTIPSIINPVKNVVVGECKIHNDASVDIATDGSILVTLLPSGGYLNVTNRLGVYSLRWETLGQCLYTTSFEQNAVSVSLSPLSRHLVVGFASRRVSMALNDRWVMARIYKIEQKDVPGDRLPILKEVEQHRENRINCIRWLPTSGQGLIFATNTGQLVILS
ncbi:hypothetical protein ABEB36_010380 [Hypothenemus hampei]|uniref:Uncharacterized protein n=1 Tax=Hypothenemus hampei TaxID=57062 RepID=A0ABD1EJJ5_HYPHA